MGLTREAELWLGADSLLHIYGDTSTIVPPPPPPVGKPTAVITQTLKQNLHLVVSGAQSTDATTGATINSWSWDLGDGQKITGVTADHTYQFPGNYSVSLTVRDSFGASNTTTQVINITAAPSNQPPTIVFIQGVNGLTATIDMTGTTDPDGTVRQIRVGWGDGAADVSNATDAGGLKYVYTHTYASAGNFVVVMTATDDQFAQTQQFASVNTTVPNAAPVVTITGVPSSGLSVTVQGTAVDPEGGRVTITVDWGDGITTPVASLPANHTYSAVGPWTVTVKATDPLGAVGQASATAYPTAPDNFQFGVTKPNASNTGLGIIAPDPNSQTLTVIAGDYTVSTDTTLDGVHILGALHANGGNVLVQNSIIDGYADVNAGILTLRNTEVKINKLKGASTDTWGVYTNTQNSAAVVQFCKIHSTLSPMSIYVAGGLGAHNITVERCNISDVMDGIDTYNKWVPSGPANIIARGNYIHGLNYLTPEPRQSDNVTHCDGIQIAGGDGVTFLGNNVEALAGTFSNAPKYLDGTHPQALSGVMLTPNTGPITGTNITQNWLSGGEITVNGGALDRQGGANYGTVAQNRMGRNPYFAGANIGFDAVASGKWSAIGNVFEDDGTPVPIHWNY